MPRDLPAVPDVAVSGTSEPDHWRRLGVARGAAAADNPDCPDALRRFQLASQAHDVLSDPQQRAAYAERVVSEVPAPAARFDPYRAAANER
eukprot:gene3176-4934_t